MNILPSTASLQVALTEMLTFWEHEGQASNGYDQIPFHIVAPGIRYCGGSGIEERIHLISRQR